MSVQIGLALGGGGARGSYQIGILKALDEAGILKSIKHVSGSSIGAVNTLMVMAKLSHERMIEIWSMIDNSNIYGQGLDRLKMDRLGLFSLQDLFETLSKEVSISEIRESKIQGYATVSRMKKESFIEQILIHRMKKEVFHLNESKNPLKAVLASSSIPVLFGSTMIDDEPYVDGGILDNCPVQPLLDAGCNIILAVPIEGHLKIKRYMHQCKLLVNFETHYLFHKIPFDVLDFKPMVVQVKADYGYEMGKLMMKKLKNLDLLNEQGQFSLPKDDQYVMIEKKEETILRKHMNKGVNE